MAEPPELLAPSNVLEFRRPSAPWQKPGGIGHVLSSWREDGRLYRHFALDTLVPERPARLTELPVELSPQVASALQRRGVKQLYTHQAEAYQRARAGEHVVVATPTASGKSLCYNLPVLDAFARDSEARALYLFPTKALARDQEVALHDLMHAAALTHGAITYDGDTPGDARRAAREKSGVLVTNPDMLHTGILPHHASWARLFANLRFIVIDELHSYRGVFGSHLANVLRRLLRVARFHGGSPTVMFASATIGNPREHAERILGDAVSLVHESGAPAGEKHVMVFNPPLLNPELGIRASYIKTAVRLTADLVRAGVSTIVFGQSRNSVEVMLKYLRDRLGEDGVDPETIHAYRGGYLPETRRRIEAGLREGAVRCVVATNALELGIDIGALDAVVCAGYPGSVAGLWQRFGRGGRRGEASLALLVTSSAPLDQFFAADPEALIGAPVEHARIDPDNIEILVAHLKCAAFELPFEEGEAFGDVPPSAIKDALDYLAESRIVHPVPATSGRNVYHWASDVYPANHVSLRTASWDNFAVIDIASDHTIAEMDWRSTHTMLHEQAIYQHLGEQYQVERLDYENHKAYVRKVAPDYYTDAMTYTRVAVLEDDVPSERVSEHLASTLAGGMGEVSVVSKVVGYKKIKFHTHENVGYGDVHLPEMQMHTSAMWLTIGNELVTSLGVARPLVIDALRGLANALHTVACVGLMTDPRDLGRTVTDKAGEGATAPADGGWLVDREPFHPTIFLYDSVAGGVGLAPRLHEDRVEMLVRAHALIRACPCSAGCPSCIGPGIGVGVAQLAGAPQSALPAAAMRQLEAAPLMGELDEALVRVTDNSQSVAQPTMASMPSGDMRKALALEVLRALGVGG